MTSLTPISSATLAAVLRSQAAAPVAGAPVRTDAIATPDATPSTRERVQALAAEQVAQGNLDAAQAAELTSVVAPDEPSTTVARTASDQIESMERLMGKLRTSLGWGVTYGGAGSAPAPAARGLVFRGDA